MPDRTPVQRYALASIRSLLDTHVLAAALIGFAIISIVITRSPWSLVVALPIGALGVYRYFRPFNPAWYVELADRELVIHILGSTTIPYSQIDSSTQLRPTGFGRRVESVAMRFAGVSGSPDNRVKLKFRKWLWCTLLPPLRIPRPSWAIPMEDPEQFAADVNARVADKA